MANTTERFSILCHTFGTIVGLGGIACVFIVWISLGSLHNITDAAMFAIALMALAPAILGVGVALFLYLAFAAETRQPGDSFDHGAANESIRKMDGPRG